MTINALQRHLMKGGAFGIGDDDAFDACLQRAID